MVSLACLPSYSYSEVIYGQTKNAAQDSLTWVMTNVLPQQTGLKVGTVVYQYTTVKKTEDDMIVYVQNENAQGDGYIFRDAEDWSGIPGNSINKVISVNQIPIEFWGDGSIEIEGDGKVVDPNVVYTYQYDTCFDPQSSPECPGYKFPIPDIPQVEIVDPLDDQFIQDEIDRKMTMRDEDEEENDRQRMESKESDDEEEVDIEQILGIVDRSLQSAQDAAMHSQLQTMNNFSQVYFIELPETKYEETLVLEDNDLPRNRRNLRLMQSQQLLHDQIVKSQYNLGK